MLPQEKQVACQLTPYLPTYAEERSPLDQADLCHVTDLLSKSQELSLAGLPEDTLLTKEGRVKLMEASAVILSTSVNQCAPLSSLAGSSPANSKWLPGKGGPVETGWPPEDEQELEKGRESYIIVGQHLSDTYLPGDKVSLLCHLCTSMVYYLLC